MKIKEEFNIFKHKSNHNIMMTIEKMSKSATLDWFSAIIMILFATDFILPVIADDNMGE